MVLRMITTTTTTTTTTTQTEAAAPKHITVKLRRRRSRVRWAEDVVDNEDMCRKKSKKCCVFHRPRGLDESSGDETDDDYNKILSGDACCGPDAGPDAGPSTAQPTS